MKKIFVSLVLIFAVGSLFAENNSTIVLDAAHGGKDTGTQSKITINTQKVKLYEKDITLAICKRVQALLNDKEASLNLVLTRNSDTFISLKKRNAVLDENAICISIHCETSTDKNKRGFSVLIAENASENTKKLAGKLSENLEREIADKMPNLGILTYENAQNNIIVNIGYLSNENDAILLMDENFIDACAKAILKAIAEYSKAK